MANQEPILADNGSRKFSAFPIQYPDMWDMYKKAVATFWTTEEVPLNADVVDWREKLNDDERHFIKHILGFFAGSDGIVMENLQTNFSVEVTVPEARQFYAYQTFNESIHSEQYALLIDALISDEQERNELFDAIENIPAVHNKAKWAQKWLEPGKSFAERLVAWVCVEGILFSGSFCAIFWLRNKGVMPGLCLSNEFISRDEGLHQQFGELMYSKLQNKLPFETVKQIITEAVENEKEFICDAIPCRLIGMNATLMKEYIEFVADRIFVTLGYDKVYNSKNPFAFMELISLQGKTNFFEKRVSDYQRPGVMKPEDNIFAIDDDF
ncbi:ribonucleoside-diphosphate reductase small subunit [Paramecium bursaria Chlorella virus CvsA1]|nr:ribonucleoside-diphosphate reductase small subunit [Paramecium bursaria Chlorella virus CviKI]AGE52606.1 ribonucleoside-diphosphate reductase small subunit [Paramecium bursaria Chlorella virus CvsA1]